MGVKTITTLSAFLLNILAISCSNDASNPENEVTEIANEETTTDTTGSDAGNPDGSPQASALKILPLGDSRVEGDRPDHESYRYELWKMLTDNNIDFDFVGTKMDKANYPDHQGLAFDTDHEGTGGATTDFLLDGIDETLEDEIPDLVLLGIGGNDLNNGTSIEDTIANIAQLIDGIQLKSPNVTIILEQIAPAKSTFMTAERYATLEAFNTEIQKLANDKSSEASEVVTVDMALDWSDDYLADDLHYNEMGAAVVASRYYKVLTTVGQE